MKNSFLLFGLIASLFFITITDAEVWNFILDDYGTIKSVNSLDLKSDGDPCFAYIDLGNEIAYTCYDKETGIYHTRYVYVDATGLLDLALDIDRLDNAHIVFSRFVGGTTYCSYYWHSTTGLDGNYTHCTIAPQQVGISADVNNNPHIVVATYWASPIERFRIGGEWITATLPYSESWWKFANIRTSDDGYKYIYTFSHSANAVHISNSTPLYSTAWGYSDKRFSTIGSDLEIHKNYVYIHDEYIKKQNVSHSANFTDFIALNPIIIPYATSLGLTSRGNVHATYIENSILYHYHNETGVWVENPIADSVYSYFAYSSLVIDQLTGTRWVVFSKTDNIIRLGHSAPSYQVSGIIRDGTDLNPIDLIWICFINRMTGLYTCDYTDTNGYYSVSIAGGSYNISLIDTPLNRYIPMYLTNVIIDTDIPNMDFYMYRRDLPLNLSLVKLFFIDEKTSLPMENLNIMLEYLDCLQGCPTCCAYRGHKYYATTDVHGKIVRLLPLGLYGVSVIGRYNLWNDVELRWTSVVEIPADTPTYTKTFKVRYLDRVFSISGFIYDSENLRRIANATIVLLDVDKTYLYIGTANDEGEYLIEGIYPATYDIVAKAKGYIDGYKLNYKIPCKGHYDIDANCSLNFYLLNATERLYSTGGIVRDLEENPIPNVKINVFNEFIQKNTTSDAFGNWIIHGLRPARYFLRIEKEGYELFCHHLNGDCEVINNILHKVFSVGHADYIPHDIVLVNITQINFHCMRGVVSFNNTPIHRAIIAIKPRERDFPRNTFGWFSEQVVYTNASGHYEFCGLRAYKCFVFLAVAPTFEDYSNTICIPDKDITYDIHLKLQVLTASVDFYTRGEDYEPVPSDIFIYSGTDVNRTNILYQLMTDKDGLYSDFKLPHGYYIMVFKPKISGYPPEHARVVNVVEDIKITVVFPKVADFYDLTIYALYFSENITTLSPLPNVMFTIRKLDTNHTYSKQTSERDGSVLFQLPKGHYEITYHSEKYVVVPKIDLPKIIYLDMNTILKFTFSDIDVIGDITLEKGKETAMMEIQRTIFTLVPSIFTLVLIMFVISIMRKATVG